MILGDKPLISEVVLSQPPTTSQISEAAHCRHMPHETRSPPWRGRRGRSRPPPVRSLRPPTATTCHMRPDRHRAVVEAASRQSDLRGRPLSPRETRPPPRCAHRGRSHPPRHGCLCVAWWGRERGAAAALILVRWLVGWEEVASHAPPSRHLRRLASCHRKNKRRERERMEERER
jgi:hypothetical protein